MTRPEPWTVAVADGTNPSSPSIAYVTNAHDRDDAIARVHAHHTSRHRWDSARILTAAAAPGIPPADACWTDLRGIKALRVVLEPGQVRQLARLRLRMRRWNNLMDSHYAAEAATGTEIPPSAWHAYSDGAEAICQAINPMLFGQVSA